MKITDVNVFPVVGDEKLKAFVTIVVGGFKIRDIKIINGREGLFVSMPSKKRTRGGFRDLIHPINKETRELLEDAVLGAYKQHRIDVLANDARA